MTRDLVDQMGGGRGSPPRGFDDDDSSSRVRLHDLTMVQHYDAGKAVLVSDTGEEARAVWLPRSKIEIHRTGKFSKAVNKAGQQVSLPVVIVTIPEWMAKDKGLI